MPSLQTFSVLLEAQEGFAATVPSPPNRSHRLDLPPAGVLLQFDFGIHTATNPTGESGTGSLSGRIYSDENGDGVSNGDGFNVGGEDNELDENRSEGNPFGFFVTGNANTLEENLAQNNQQDGVRVTGNENTVKDNTARDNGGEGFVDDGNGNVFEGNKG